MHPLRTHLAAGLAALLSAAPLLSQPAVPDGARVRQALEYAARTEPRTIEEQIAICEIEAPPFKEARRAEDYRRRFAELGLRVRIDSV
ncbi:MAG TPA: hypothetical protein VEW03_12350, partial [Longimicrobiaceae bacterium]|nr:hypothetical protein [Longimicrobiaceae bacterium]